MGRGGIFCAQPTAASPAREPSRFAAAATALKRSNSNCPQPASGCHATLDGYSSEAPYGAAPL